MNNRHENDKFLTKERKIYLETWIIIAIYLAIALPIHFCVPAFSWHWFTFGLIFLIIPLGLICSKTYFENKMNLTAEQQKKFNQVFGVGMLKLWLADFVYMTAFNHWLIPTYILGVILLIIVFNSLVNAFLGKRDNNSFLNFCLAADLIIGIALTIYLIYIIPDNTGNLQNIITTIVAAIYGGLLTLVGVAWTIRSEREKDRLEEKKKYKPLAIYFKGGKDIDYTITLNEYDENRFVSFQKSDKNRCARIIKDFMLRNLELNDFFVEGLIFNESSKLLRYANLYVEKNKIILFSFQDTMLYFAQPIEKIGVLVKDLLNNEYIFELGFENEIQAPEKICIHITGSKGIIEYKENEGKQNG